jgi:hypothetical protein
MYNVGEVSAASLSALAADKRHLGTAGTYQKLMLLACLHGVRSKRSLSCTTLYCYPHEHPFPMVATDYCINEH